MLILEELQLALTVVRTTLVRKTMAFKLEEVEMTFNEQAPI